MENTKYLITGATGATGSEAVAALLEAGQDVRALVHREDERAERLRDQGAEVVIGDLLDFHTVQKALQGTQRAYFCFPIAPGLVQATAQFAQAAKEAGVDAIVNMSQKIAREDASSHAAFQHWLAERVFDWSAIPATHLRPTFFAEWFLYFSPMIRQGKVFAPYGSGRHAPIAAEDQGRVIASILQDPKPHAGQIYSLYGSVEYTFLEMIALAGTVLGKQVEYQQVPFEMMRDAFLAGRTGSTRNDAISGYAESNPTNGDGEPVIFQHLREAVTDHNNGLFSGTNDVVERLTGRAPMTVEEFISKHSEAFTHFEAAQSKLGACSFPSIVRPSLHLPLRQKRRSRHDQCQGGSYPRQRGDRQYCRHGSTAPPDSRDAFFQLPISRLGSRTPRHGRDGIRSENGEGHSSQGRDNALKPELAMQSTSRREGIS